MKKLIFLLLVLCSTTLYAQISEADARMQYQQAEDAYNKTDYMSALNITFDLYEKMNGKWVPKVLYLHIKSAYKNLTEPNQTSSERISKSWGNFAAIYVKCLHFFDIVDKKTYPPDKYKEMQDIQKWSKAKEGEYAHQKDRKPQDAVDFLNECIKNYGRPPIRSELAGEAYGVKNQFQLKGSNLLLIKEYSYHASAYIRPSSSGETCVIDRIDLTKVNNLMLDGDTKLLIEGQVYEKNSSGNPMADATTNRYDRINSTTHSFWCWESESIDVKASKKNRSEFDNFRSNAVEKPETIIKRKKDNMDFLQFFTSGNSQFKNEKYAERIKDALQFLIDYFPKYKEEEVQVKEQPKSKF